MTSSPATTKDSHALGAAFASALLWTVVMGATRFVPTWWGAIFGAVTAGLYVRSYLRRADVDQRAKERFGLPPARAWAPFVLAALAIAVFNTALLILWGGWPARVGVDPDGPPIHVVQAVLFVPIVEELAFRGRLLRVMEIRTPGFRSVLYTAMIFAVLHFSPKQPITGMLPALTIACLFGTSARLTGSIWIGAGLHAVGNGTVMLFDALQSALPPALPALQMRLLATGGLALALGLALLAFQLWRRQGFEHRRPDPAGARLVEAL